MGNARRHLTQGRQTVFMRFADLLDSGLGHVDAAAQTADDISGMILLWCDEFPDVAQRAVFAKEPVFKLDPFTLAQPVVTGSDHVRVV